MGEMYRLLNKNSSYNIKIEERPRYIVNRKDEVMLNFTLRLTRRRHIIKQDGLEYSHAETKDDVVERKACSRPGLKYYFSCEVLETASRCAKQLIKDLLKEAEAPAAVVNPVILFVLSTVEASIHSLKEVHPGEDYSEKWRTGYELNYVINVDVGETKFLAKTASPGLGLVEKQCSVCLSDYSDGAEVQVLACMHVFHGACVDRWCKFKKSCPICRAKIRTSNPSVFLTSHKLF